MTQSEIQELKSSLYPSEVLVLVTCNEDMTSYNGFVWPESGCVEAPDWDPAPWRGGGLHGYEKGEHVSDYINTREESKWLVVRVNRENGFVVFGGMCIFRCGEVIYSGNRYSAAEILKGVYPEAAVPYSTEIVKGAGTAITGYGGTSTSEHSGISIAGDCGGATSENYGISIAGDWGGATSKFHGISIARQNGKASSEDCGISIAGLCGVAKSKGRGVSIADVRGVAKSKGRGVSIAQDWGKASTGIGGVIVVYDPIARKMRAAEVDGKTIKADTLYKLEDGEFVEVEEAK